MTSEARATAIGREAARYSKPATTVENADAFPHRVSFAENAALALMLVLPLLIAPAANEPFRLPKTLLLHVFGIAVVTWWTARLILRGERASRATFDDRYNRLAAAILGWTLITTLTSIKPLASGYSLLTAVSLSAFFILIRRAAANRGTSVLAALIIPSTINAALAILQELRIWNPFRPPASTWQHSLTTALLGNPNDVGSFLVPAFVMLAAGLTLRGHARRLLTAAMAVLVGSALVLSQTRGAMMAAVAGAIAVAITRWRKRAIVPIILGVLISLLASATYKPLLDRFSGPDGRLRLTEFISGRAIAFVAASDMFSDHPFFGVGPGCYSVAYFDYAIRAMAESPSLSMAGQQQNFGETHNDHLQIAAETGFVGYVLFLAACGMLAAVSFVGVGDGASLARRLAAVSALPVAVSLMVLSLTQFPLQLSAASAAYVFAAAACIGWSDAR